MTRRWWAAPYGQFKVDVDGKTVVEGGRLAMLGVLPSAVQVLEAVREELGKGGERGSVTPRNDAMH